MILAIDYGDRWIGLAAGDPPGTPVHRYGVIDQKNQNALDGILQIISKEGVKRILVGVPISLQGNETEQTHKTLAFIDELRDAIGPEIDIETVDETLPSVEAQKMLEHEGADTSQVHAEAARLILEDYLRQQDQGDQQVQ